MSGETTIPGYQHVRVLGEGASGTVVQAEHLESGTPVAIKYLSPRLVQDEAFLVRFREEARLLADLSDPNLVRFHEYVETPQTAAIVMELVDGVSLAALLESEGATEPEAALVVLKGSLLGLSAAHAAGVVHRDYKPGNVLVRGDGASLLADFGIAVRAGDMVPTAGTPAYMAPEQWNGDPAGPAADVYAATAVFYECMTGERPYPAQTIPQLALAHRTAAIPVDQVPEQLRDLVEHGLAKDPDDRPPSARTFLGELEAVAFGAYGVGWEERGRNQLKERAALLALLFPMSGAPGGASAVGLTEFGDDDARPAQAAHGAAAAVPKTGGKGHKIGVVAAIGALALLLIGGGTAAVIAGSNSSEPLAGVTPSAGPSTDPSGDPSGDPSADPSVSPTEASPSPSATPSASPSPTAAPQANLPGGGGQNGAGTGGVSPSPKATKPKTTPKPTKTKPAPFQVTGVSVSVQPPNADLVGSFTVTVTTTGAPKQAVPLTFRAANAKLKESSSTVGPGSYTYDTGEWFGSSRCQDVTIYATAYPPGQVPITKPGTYSASSDPRCSIG